MSTPNAPSVFDPSQYSNLREYVEAVQGAPLDYSRANQQDILNAAINAMYGNKDTSALQSFFPGQSAAVTTPTVQQTTTPAGALTQATQPSYFGQNPDVAAAYADKPYGMTPEEFASYHYQTYGAAEGRAAPLGYSPQDTVQGPVVRFTPGIADQTAEQKATEYSNLLDQGFTDAQIRAAADAQFGAQSDADWNAITGLAAQNAVTGLYRDFLGRTPEQEGMDFWVNHFGPSIDEQEREQFRLAAAEEIKKQFGVGADVPAYFVQNPDVKAAYEEDNMGMTPEEFARAHYELHGSGEGRTDADSAAILAGFKYAKDYGISDDVLKNALGEELFNQYNQGLTNFAVTNLTNIIADDQLTWDEARRIHDFGRDLGLTADDLAQMTGQDKSLFELANTSYINGRDQIIKGALTDESVTSDVDRVLTAIALQDRYKFTDDDIAQATGYDVDLLKSSLDPVRNFSTTFESAVNSPDTTTSQLKTLISDSRSNAAINKMYGSALNDIETKINGIEQKWGSHEGVDPLQAENLYNQLEAQKKAIGGQYYSGVFGDTKNMAAVLNRKGLETIGDLGQKDKFQTETAYKTLTGPDGQRVQQDEAGNFLSFDSEGNARYLSPDQVTTTYTKAVYGGYDDPPSFVPLTETELATLKDDGTFQNKIGTVVIDKDTGKELTGVDGVLHTQRSGGTFTGKKHFVNVGFTPEGVPILTATQQKTGIYGFVSDVAPMALAIASFIPGPHQPFARLANAALALEQKNYLGAVLSGLSAYGQFTGNELATLRAAEAAGDVVDAGRMIELQNTLSNVKLATTFAQGAAALQAENIPGLINAGLSAYGQLGNEPLPSGVTTAVQLGNFGLALENKQYDQALSALGDLTGSKDMKIAGAAKTLVDQFQRASESGDFSGVVNAGLGFANILKSGPATTTKTTTDAGGITNRIYDDTIVQAGADAFIAAKNAGASDEDAMAASDAVTGSTVAKTGGYDLGEFEGVDKAIADVTARNTVVIRNDEANTPDEAFALARSRDPSATKFTFGGQEYTIGASSGQMSNAVRDAQLAEIKDLPSFSDAFSQARQLLGPNQTFEWNGKQYSTATFAERPDLGGNVVPGATSTTAGAGRGSYAGYNSAEEMVNKVKSTPTTTEYGGPTVLGVPIGTPQDALNTVNRMGDVVLDFSRGIGEGFGNFMNQVGTLAHIASASISGGDTKNTLISRDNLLSTLGRDLAGYYSGMTTEQSNKEWKNFVSDVSKAPEYLKPFVALQSGLQNFGGVVNALGGEVGEEVAPLLSGFGVGSKLLQLGASGTAKSVAVASTLGDMAESAQGSYDNVMERLKDNKNMTDEEKHWKATQAAAGSMAATAVFGYGANSYLAKSIMGDMIASPAQKVLGPLAVEYITEYPESFIQTLNERFAEKGSVDAADIRDANTDGAISALLGAKTAGTISGTVQVVGKVSNDFVGAESGDKSGIAIIQSPDGQIGFAPAGNLNVGQELNADNLPQIQSVSDLVGQFNFDSEQAARITDSVEQLDLTRADRQEASDQEASSFNPSDIDISSVLQSGSDAGVTSEVQDGVSITTDSNTGATTTVDSNTGVTTQTSTNPNNNAQTTITSDTNNNTATETVVNPNTNVTTQTTVNNNTNITTQVTTNSNTNTETTVTTDPNTNIQTTVVVNADTGEVIEEKETEIPSDWTQPKIEISGTPATQPGTKKPEAKAKAAAPKLAGTAGLAGGMGAMLPAGFDMDPSLLPSRETQKSIDPLQRVMEAQAELEKTAMMQQIDPRLLNVLQQRVAPEQQVNRQQQFDRDIGALSRLLSGQPEPSNENSFYSYGSEDSIDDILGGKAANYAAGGYVEPLKASGGSMALPLLAKSGGALGQYGGRENFKDGKHVAGEGDGQSDDIPAWLADGEFVFPADVVSALGNGSTKAGTDKLYEMMHSIRDRARSKGPKDLPPPAFKSPLDYLKSHKRSK